MELEHKLVLVKDEAGAEEVQDALNAGFVLLATATTNDYVLMTLAKAAKPGVVSPGGIPFPPGFLDEDKGKKA